MEIIVNTPCAPRKPIGGGEVCASGRKPKIRIDTHCMQARMRDVFQQRAYCTSGATRNSSLHRDRNAESNGVMTAYTK